MVGRMSQQRAVLPVVTLIALVAMGSAAHAAKDVQTDATGDMIVLPGTTPNDPAAAPQVTAGDIVTVTSNHKAKTLVLTTAFVERTDEFSGWRVKTPNGDYFVSLSIFNLPQPTAGLLTLYRQGADEDEVCRGLRRVALPTTSDSIRVKVPRKCLGDPRWVRVGGLASDSVDDVQYADESQRVGQVNQYRNKVGPKVVVG
jgi:hypothetical protein